jgi:hypothetical protein
MELLERYLQAVRGYLLRSRRDDIVKELGDNIFSQMEDKAAELGRPLNKNEQAAILKQHGHPLVAAAPYRRLPLQQLIGPTLFPLYWYAVQAMVAFALIFHVVLVVVLSLNNGSALSGLGAAWSSFWVWILMGIGALTIGFGFVEYLCGGKIPFTATFDPFDLPEIKKSIPPYGEIVARLVLGGLFLVGWPLFLHLQVPAIAKACPFALSPVWRHFELPILLVVALGIAAAFVALFRPKYPRLRIALRLASDITGVITLYFFLMAGELIVARPGISSGLATPVQVGKHILTTGQLANYGMALGPLITLIFFICDGLMQITRLLRSQRKPVVVTYESNAIS